MEGHIYIDFYRVIYGYNWWWLMNVVFIIPFKIILKNQIVDRKPINNPIQGRCY